MQLIKLDNSYKDQFYRVWKAAFGDEFDDEHCDKFFNQEDLWNYAYGWLDGDQLVSTYLSLEVKVLLRNKEFRGHYIDGIATLPSHRRRGLVHQQMLNDAQECLKQNIPLMVLDPSRDSFYRKLGFEYALDKFRIRIKREFCSNCSEDSTYRVDMGLLAENQDLQTGYRAINKWLYENPRYNEMKWPACYEEIKYQHGEMQIAIAYDSSNKPCGYMLFTYEDKNMVIESFRYINLRAFYALKRYMLNVDEEVNNFVFTSIPQDFPIDLLLTDLGRPEERLIMANWRSRMARIVDVQGLLEGLIVGTPQKQVHICIADEILPHNAGVYTITPEGKVLKALQKTSDITMTISDIVPLLTGLKSAQELYYNGKLKVGDDAEVYQGVVPEVVEVVDSLLPKVITYNAEDYLAP